MPYDSNGQASVAGNRPVNGQDTDAAQINVPLADIQSMLSQVLLKSGVAPMTGNLNMNGFKINNLAEGTTDSDPVTLSQVQALLTKIRTVPIGAVQPLRSKTAPDGWLIEDGKTIGNATSGATGRANADTVDLFTHLWNQFTNTELPIQTSGGVVTTRGASATADYAANKRMPLFDSRTRFLRGSDADLGFDASLTVGTAQNDAIKAHKHPTPAVTINVNTTTSQVNSTNNLYKGGAFDSTLQYTAPASETGDNTGGIALETRPRSSVALFCIKL